MRVKLTKLTNTHQMASTTTKNILLSQIKAGQGDAVQLPSLAHNSTTTDSHTEVQIEIPGVDPSTVSIHCEGTVLEVSCPKGAVNVPINALSDASKIEADILWGMLTIKVPLPPEPVSRDIKVNVVDVVKKVPHKAPEKKVTGEESGV
jgi:HSP20 family molecular chaperone IbpA